MILLGKVALGMAGVCVAGAAMLCSEGMVHVKVIEKQPHGAHINVIAPAMLAPIAVRLAPPRALEQATQEIQPQMPMIRAALEGLRDSEDIVLVEVKGPDQHLEVSKAGGSIIIDVDDRDATVHVTAPIRAISRAVEELAAVDSGPM